MAFLSIHLLGQLKVLVDGEPVTGFESDKVRALLIYLAVEADRPHRREALASLLWAERPEHSALSNLRGALSNLRSSIHDHAATPPFLLATRQSIQFNQASEHFLDVSRLAALSGHAATPIPVSSLEEIIDLYQGPFLEGFSIRDSAAFEEWYLIKREQIGRWISRAYQQLVAKLKEGDDLERAIGYAWRWVELDPLDEEAHRWLMQLLHASGQRAAAIAQYETLCSILDEELGVEPSEETQELHHRLLVEKESASRDLPASAPQEPCSPQIDLPVPTTSFIGREGELDQIARLLSEPACKLLTLTGPGGVGKTRLALQAACEHPSDFPDGVFFVPLTPLSSSEFLVSTIATALKFDFYGAEDPKDQLLNHLRSRKALVVLDSFEHLLDGADVVADILRTAPNIRIMVTSRERLNLHGEWLFEVVGMRFPQDGDPCGATCDSVQLFMENASRVRPGFSPDNTGESSIARICQLMQGNPLAIELAATWLRTLSAEQIVAEIEGGLEFLQSSLRDVPERHRSLWAAFDHSWKLLSEEQQLAFRRLSVFRGGFERTAAEDIAGASLSILSALVDKSLVRRNRSGRYEIHELLRQYAERQLIQAGEEEVIKQAHRDWFLTQAQQLVPQLWSNPEAAARLERLLVERDNHRAALQWSLDHEDAEESLQMVIALNWFWYIRSDYSEGRRWLHRALNAGESASPRVLAYAHSFAGSLAIMQQDHEQGVPLTEKGLQGHLESENFFEAGWTLMYLGLAAMYQGDFEKADELYARSVAQFEEIGFAVGKATVRTFQGMVAYYQQDYEKAETLLGEGLPVLRKEKDSIAVARAVHGLGMVALHHGDLPLANRYFREGLAEVQGMGARLELAQLLEDLAIVGSQQGRDRWSCELLGFSEMLRETISTPLTAAERTTYDQCLSRLHASLDEQTISTAWADGKRMTLQEMLRRIEPEQEQT